MSTPIEKIEIGKKIIRVFRELNNEACFVDEEVAAEVSSVVLAEKINEIIDFCNNKAITLNLCKHEYDIKDGATCTKCGQVRVFPIHIID